MAFPIFTNVFLHALQSEIMCGIAGIFNHGRTEAVSASMLQTMRDRMVHRGPDDSGIHVTPDARAGLAHRRLSIIDLSEMGRQPMCDDSGTLWITFNGEIYNFRELRADLKSGGVRFRSQSDTEVLLYLYKKHGKEMVQLLRGMFAFAIYDERDSTLFLARDRMGIKPLYYFQKGGSFVFASEIKALFETGWISRDLNQEALYHYLSFLTTPAPQTLFDGIFKLPAAHRLMVDSSGNVIVERWWSPLPQRMLQIDEDAATECVLDLLRTSIRYRMISDVPFGVFLSGGIDSSTNVALMAEMMDRPVESFSIAFSNQPTFNEFAFARMVADRFHTNHHEIEIDMQDLLDFLPKLIYHQDEPIADPVCVPVYYVSKLAKENGVTVCQVGEGSDELFCGYPYWSMVLDLDRIHRMYSLVPAPLRRLTAYFAKHFDGPESARREYIRRASHDEPLFWGGAEAFFEPQKAELLHPDFRRRLNGTSSAKLIASYFAEYLAGSPSPDRLGWMTYMDLQMRLPELLLMRIDKMTMATSVEARVPFLDHKLVEFVMALPQQRKIPNLRVKHLLKKAVRGVIPDAIIDRPKQGFGVPVVEWFQRELGHRMRHKLLSFSAQHPYFNRTQIEKLLGTGNEPRAWYLYNFALWHETWIEEKMTAPCD
jgi:asparagine synthase (glutamine-hydrolysing)